MHLVTVLSIVGFILMYMMRYSICWKGKNVVKINIILVFLITQESLFVMTHSMLMLMVMEKGMHLWSAGKFLNAL